ncbi:colanic acid exporter [Cognatishimia activa]|uniref:Colanic acid exporter n=2 Tax=Cognatishimia activa TaxID=1715691 RepID=A0A0P1J2Q0_9RHOB|nr:oligosaccharide flippase family protein [Cognatishimia activa]CUK27330.1 colanic acid exporter [Cognatishimia activa]
MREDSQAHSRQRPLSIAMLAMLGAGSQQVASFVIMLLAARFLPLSDYGTFMLAMVFVELATTMMHSGFYHYVVRSERDDVAVQSSMFWVILGIGALSGGTMVIAAPWLAMVFQSPDLAAPMIGLGLLQPGAAVIAWASACLTRQERMRAYFNCLTFSNLGGLAAGITLLLLWPSIYALLAYRACRVGLGLITFCGANRYIPNWRMDWLILREAAKFSRGLYGTRLLEFFANFGTDLLLAFFFSTSESGLYRIANRLANAAIDVVALPLRNMALKSFARQVRNHQPTGSLATDFLSANFVAAGIMAVLSIVFGPTHIRALFDPSYGLAIPAFYALCLRGLALSGQRVLEPLFAAHDLNLSALRHNTIWTVALIVVTATLAPFGLFTLSVGQALVGLATTIAAIRLMRSNSVVFPIELRRPFQKSVTILMLATCAAALSFGMIDQTQINDGIKILTYAPISMLLAAVACLGAIRWQVFSPKILHSR